jgi:uncharacterized protein YecT (DUF1311 family)
MVCELDEVFLAGFTGVFGDKEECGSMKQLGMWALIAVMVGILIVCNDSKAIKPTAKQIDDRTACARLAVQQYQGYGNTDFETITLLDQDLSGDKYEGQVGKQFISTVLTGHGLLKYRHQAPQDIRFTCLLESNEKAVFFDAREDAAMDPLTHCSAGKQTIGESVPCLKSLLQSEEAKLAALQQKMAQEGARIDKNWKTSQAKQSLTQSDADWEAYRDAECTRQAQFRMGGNHPDITQFQCLIGQTRDRIQALSSN